MQVDLSELMKRSRPLSHPTRITGVTFSDQEMRWSIQWHSWWREDDRPPAGAEITFIFKGIASGSLDLGMALDSEYDEILEFFDISPLVEHDWAQPYGFEIYGSAPLPDPLSLYARVEDYLWEADASKTARDFLNMGDGGLLKDFAEFTRTQAYLIAKVPESIRQVVCEELQKQAVPYNVVGGKGRPDNGFLVRFGEASFVCEEATAEWN